MAYLFRGSYECPELPVQFGDTRCPVYNHVLMINVLKEGEKGIGNTISYNANVKTLPAKRGWKQKKKN